MIVSNPNAAGKPARAAPPGKPRKTAAQKAREMVIRAQMEGTLSDLLWVEDQHVLSPKLQRDGWTRKASVVQRQEDMAAQERERQRTALDTELLDNVSIWNKVLSARVLGTLDKLKDGSRPKFVRPAGAAQSISLGWDRVATASSRQRSALPEGLHAIGEESGSTPTSGADGRGLSKSNLSRKDFEDDEEEEGGEENEEEGGEEGDGEDDGKDGGDGGECAIRPATELDPSLDAGQLQPGHFPNPATGEPTQANEIGAEAASVAKKKLTKPKKKTHRNQPPSDESSLGDGSRQPSRESGSMSGTPSSSKRQQLVVRNAANKLIKALARSSSPPNPAPENNLDQLSSLEEQLRAFDSIALSSRESKQSLSGKKPERMVDLLKRTRSFMQTSLFDGEVSDSLPSSVPDSPEGDVRWGGATRGDSRQRSLILSALKKFRSTSPSEVLSDLMQVSADFREDRLGSSRDAIRRRESSRWQVDGTLGEEEDAERQQQQILAHRRAALARLQKLTERYVVPLETRTQRYLHFWQVCQAEQEKWIQRQGELEGKNEQMASLEGEEEIDTKALGMGSAAPSGGWELERFLEESLGAMFEAKARQARQLAPSSEEVSHVIQHLKLVGVYSEADFRYAYGLHRKYPVLEPSDEEEEEGEVEEEREGGGERTEEEEQEGRVNETAKPPENTYEQQDDVHSRQVRNVSASRDRKKKTPSSKLRAAAARTKRSPLVMSDEIDDEYSDGQTKDDGEGEDAHNVFLTSLTNQTHPSPLSSPTGTVRERMNVMGPSTAVLDPDLLTHPLEERGGACLRGRWRYDPSLHPLPCPTVPSRPSHAIDGPRRARKPSPGLARRMSYPIHTPSQYTREILFDSSHHSLLLVSYRDDIPCDCAEVPLSSVFLTDAVFPDMWTLRTMDTQSVPSGYLGTFSTSVWCRIEQEIHTSLLESHSHRLAAAAEGRGGDGDEEEEEEVDEEGLWYIPRLGRASVDISVGANRVIPTYAIRSPRQSWEAARRQRAEAVRIQPGRFEKLIPAKIPVQVPRRPGLAGSLADSVEAPSLSLFSSRAQGEEDAPRRNVHWEEKEKSVGEKSSVAHSLMEAVREETVRRCGYDAQGFAARDQNVSITIHGRPLAPPSLSTSKTTEALRAKSKPAPAAVEASNAEEQRLAAARAVRSGHRLEGTGQRPPQRPNAPPPSNPHRWQRSARRMQVEEEERAGSRRGPEDRSCMENLRPATALDDDDDDNDDDECGLGECRPLLQSSQLARDNKSRTTASPFLQRDSEDQSFREEKPLDAKDQEERVRTASPRLLSASSHDQPLFHPEEQEEQKEEGKEKVEGEEQDLVQDSLLDQPRPLSTSSSCLSFLPPVSPLSDACQVVLVVEPRRVLQLYFTKQLLSIDAASKVVDRLDQVQALVSLVPQVFGLILLAYPLLQAHGGPQQALASLLPSHLSRDSFTIVVYDLGGGEEEEGQPIEEVEDRLWAAGVEDVLQMPYSRSALLDLVRGHQRKLDLQADLMARSVGGLSP